MNLKEFLKKELAGYQVDGDNSATTVICINGGIRRLNIDELVHRFIESNSLMYRHGEFHPEGGMILADRGHKEYTLKVTRHNGHRVFFEFRRALRLK